MKGVKNLRLFVVCGLLALIPMVVDCSGHTTTSLWGTASVRHSFASYDRVAIVWQRGQNQTLVNYFFNYWMEVFPGQIVVERNDLRRVVRDQDLLPGRLDEKTRAKIRRILGVEGLILVNYSEECRSSWIPKCVRNLSIKVIDTETGAISVVANAEGRDYTGKSVVWKAIQAIKEKTQSV